MLDKRVLDLREAIDKLLKDLDINDFELTMVENNTVYDAFGKKHAPIAAELFQEELHAGEDLHASLLTVFCRARQCSYDVEDVRFWEDAAIIFSLVESYEIDEIRNKNLALFRTN